MKTGISTASLFGRYHTESALEFLNRNGVKTAEIFLESYCEYNKKFGKLLKKSKGETEINSVHVLTTQFEPQLYSYNDRAMEDSFKMLSGAMDVAKQVGAKYYTFHGGARFKKTPFVIDYDRVGKITQRIIDECAIKGVTLAYENVHWGYYNYLGFFSEIKKRTSGLKGTLDIKQARQSGISYKDFIDEMAGDIVTVHVSDYTADGKMCLPGRGLTDFYDLFSRLKDVGFDGAVLLEVYKNDFDKESELFDSLNFLNDVAAKVYK
ncbi:MAG: sugar phosphate isomerase/epimerase [Clostridia bacterium]|nr:sugar phosphate isomerase/epimerase [Clostridia bacterium]